MLAKQHPISHELRRVVGARGDRIRGFTVGDHVLVEGAKGVIPEIWGGSTSAPGASISSWDPNDNLTFDVILKDDQGGEINLGMASGTSTWQGFASMGWSEAAPLLLPEGWQLVARVNGASSSGVISLDYLEIDESIFPNFKEVTLSKWTTIVEGGKDLATLWGAPLYYFDIGAPTGGIMAYNFGPNDVGVEYRIVNAGGQIDTPFSDGILNQSSLIQGPDVLPELGDGITQGLYEGDSLQARLNVQDPGGRVYLQFPSIRSNPSQVKSNRGGAY